MATEQAHTCAVCPRGIPNRLLMCWPHWQLVPKDLQRAVVKAWSDFQWGTARQSLSARDAYLKARQDAIDAVKPSVRARAHYPEEWGPSHDRRLTCVCGNPDPNHERTAP